MRPRQFRKSVPLAALALTLLAGCQSSSNGLPVESVQVGKNVYKLEIAATDAARQKGLMERDSFAENGGMLFIFPDEKPREFWMHHTRFNLDILFLDSSGKVVSIHTMQAYNEETTPSDGPAQFAIELHEGQAAASGVHQGETIKLPATIPRGQ